MKLPRNLSGEELAKALCKDWEYAKVNQVGSHIILQTEEPSSHRISVPAHSPLRVGTLNAILRSVAGSQGRFARTHNRLSLVAEMVALSSWIESGKAADADARLHPGESLPDPKTASGFF